MAVWVRDDFSISTPDTIALIVNPVAGHGRGQKLWPALHESLRQRQIPFEVRFTGGAGDGWRWATEAKRAGFRTIVAVGGDGTVNEVVNGLMTPLPPNGQPLDTYAIDSSPPRLGIISCGTGRDLARTLGIYPGIAGLDTICSGKEIRVDIGQMRFRDPTSGQNEAERFYINSADAGLGALVAAKVNQGKKFFGGFFSFLIGALQGIVQARFINIEYQIDSNPPKRATTAVVFLANGKYTGGSMHIAPQATMTDGLLEIVMLTKVRRLDLLFRLLPRVYRGAHLGQRGVISCQGREVRISSAEPMPIEVDGEVIGHTPVYCRLHPQALTVIVPPAPAIDQ